MLLGLLLLQLLIFLLLSMISVLILCSKINLFYGSIYYMFYVLCFMLLVL